MSSLAQKFQILNILGLVDVFIHDKAIDGIYNKLSSLKSLPDDLTADINGIKTLLSGKACGEMNSAINNLTSLTNANKLVANILNPATGLLSALEGIAGIQNGIQSGTSQCLNAVNTAFGNQMSTFLGPSPTRRRLLLLNNLINNVIGNSSVLSDVTDAVDNVVGNNTVPSITGAVNNVLGNNTLPNLLSNITGMVDNILGNDTLTNLFSNITGVIADAAGNNMFSCFNLTH